MTKKKVPSAGAIIGWLGAVGTVLGIVGFFISDLPDLMGGSRGLSEDSIVSTLAAMQSDKERAELQLTQIYLADREAANLLTQQALDQQFATSQAILSTAHAAHEEFVATQNVFSGMTATADALNATATQVSLDAAATQAAIAQITPTHTPLPTITPTPAPVTDYRTLLMADVQPTSDGSVRFSAQALQPIPSPPPDGLAYVWLLDTDRDAQTGQPIQDIGIDARVAARFDNGAWIGTVRLVQPDGEMGGLFYGLEVSVDGPNVSVISSSQHALPGSFDWVIRVEVGKQVFGLWPFESHSVYLR
ncbi:MAG: hypothetical protein JXB07_05290 [Anaerolineae bacterium]|nr:hypothetical protein [Anaerolineae bacterium]